MSYEDRLYTGEKQNSRSQPGEGAVKRSEHLAKKKRGDCSPLSSVSEKKQLPCVLPFYGVKLGHNRFRWIGPWFASRCLVKLSLVANMHSPPLTNPGLRRDAVSFRTMSKPFYRPCPA